MNSEKRLKRKNQKKKRVKRKIEKSQQIASVERRMKTILSNDLNEREQMKYLVEVFDSKNVSLQEVECEGTAEARRLARNKHVSEYRYEFRPTRDVEEIPRIYTDIVEIVQ